MCSKNSGVWRWEMRIIPVLPASCRSAARILRSVAASIDAVDIATGAELPEEVNRVEAWYLGNRDAAGMFAVDAGSTQAVGQIVEKHGARDQGLKVISVAALVREPASRQRFAAEIAANEKDLEGYRRRIQQFRDAMEIGRAQIGFGDQRFVEDDEVRRTFRELLTREHQLLAAGAVRRVLRASAWCGSWLPGWRPGADYRQSYSARREFGGGVLTSLGLLHPIGPIARTSPTSPAASAATVALAESPTVSAARWTGTPRSERIGGWGAGNPYESGCAAMSGIRKERPSRMINPSSP